MPSSFGKADFEPVIIYDPATGIGSEKTREGRRLYRVRGDTGDGFVFHVGFDGSGLAVHVPEGFVTDGPSIPGWCRWLVPKAAREQAMKSAAVHDRLCEDPQFTRPEADVHFLIAMYAEKTPPFWREVFFTAVRTNSSKKVAEENAQSSVLNAGVPGA